MMEYQTTLSSDKEIFLFPPASIRPPSLIEFFFQLINEFKLIVFLSTNKNIRLSITLFITCLFKLWCKDERDGRSEGTKRKSICNH